MATPEMDAVETSETSEVSGEATRGPDGPAWWARQPQDLMQPGIIVGLLLIVLIVLPDILSTYYVDALTQAAIYSIVALGLSVLVGRVGMVSLGQGAVVAMGAWVSARLLFATSLPFPVVLLASGLITMVLGTLVGLPALRMSGLYLALITLMLAGAITVVLATLNFPNGGGGFSGYNGSFLHIPPIRRPSLALTDPDFFRYSVIVAMLMFLLVGAHLRSKPGRAWAAIRQSESAALAGGINTVLYKLWAFALASFVTGVAGGLVAGSYRFLNSLTFATQDSVVLLAVVLMGGAYSVWGAVIAGLLYKLVPQFLNDLNVSSDWLTILFGIGVLQVLTTAPAGIVEQFPKDMARLGRLLMGLARRGAPSGGSTT
jgi:branched-chain amino acid transport system permease protein